MIERDKSRASDFMEFGTRSVDSATERCRAFYGDSARVDQAKPGALFAVQLQMATFGVLNLCKLKISNWRLTRETGDSVSLLLPVTGTLSHSTSERRADHEAGKSVAVARPHQAHVFSSPRASGYILSAPMDALAACVLRLTGQRVDGAHVEQMPETIEADTPIARALTRGIKSTFAEIGSLHLAGLDALAAPGYEDLLLGLMAGALFPEIATAMDHVGDCAPTTIRKARDHIRKHATKPVELSKLAAQIGVSMRSMQENFKRYYGFSPRHYILECRLEIARQLLLSPDPSLNITKIALASGFGDLGHFSAKYRDKYGELPSETLRSSRKYR